MHLLSPLAAAAAALLLLAGCAAAQPLSIAIDARNVSGRLTPQMYGAGIESYSGEMYLLWSNLVYDDGLEVAASGALPAAPLDVRRGAASPWWAAAGAPAVVRDGSAYNGAQFLSLPVGASAANRGWATTANGSGVFFRASALYEGAFMARVAAGAGAVTVRLLCTPAGAWSPASWVEVAPPAVVPVPSAGANWTRVNFSTTTTTACLEGNGDAGIVLLEASGAAGVAVDKVMVEPGAWGRFAGMHVRADVAASFLSQGATVMRIGGSMTNQPGWRFAGQTGEPWARPPADSSWFPHTSFDLGMFELIQFAQAAGIMPVLAYNLFEDTAGLIEYLYGDAAATPWGAQRAADGHPAPYAKFPLICSNEEPQQDTGFKMSAYLPAFNSSVRALKAAAIATGAWPLIVGTSADSGIERLFDPNSTDPASGSSLAMLALMQEIGLGAEPWWDQHLFGDGANDGFSEPTAAYPWPAACAAMQRYSEAMGARVYCAVLEENGGACTLSRALGHVDNTIELQRLAPQVRAQTAAGIFMPGPPGLQDQWHVKWSAERSVWAPHAWAQQMLAASHQPNVVAGSFHTASSNHIALVSDDGRSLTLRVKNPSGSASNLTATLAAPPPPAGSAWARAVAVQTLAGPSLGAQNDFDSPDAVAPVAGAAALDASADVLRYEVPAFSFVVFTFTAAA